MERNASPVRCVGEWHGGGELREGGHGAPGLNRSDVRPRWGGLASPMEVRGLWGNPWRLLRSGRGDGGDLAGWVARALGRAAGLMWKHRFRRGGTTLAGRLSRKRAGERASSWTSSRVCEPWG